MEVVCIVGLVGFWMIEVVFMMDFGGGVDVLDDLEFCILLK